VQPDINGLLVFARDIDCADDNDLSSLPFIPYDTTPRQKMIPLRRPPGVWEAIASSNAVLSFAGTRPSEPGAR
jgi:hypothetical protein